MVWPWRSRRPQLQRAAPHAVRGAPPNNPRTSTEHGEQLPPPARCTDHTARAKTSARVRPQLTRGGCRRLLLFLAALPFLAARARLLALHVAPRHLAPPHFLQHLRRGGTAAAGGRMGCVAFECWVRATAAPHTIARFLRAAADRPSGRRAERRTVAALDSVACCACCLASSSAFFRSSANAASRSATVQQGDGGALGDRPRRRVGLGHESRAGRCAWGVVCGLLRAWVVGCCACGLLREGGGARLLSLLK